jgi:TolC family type I secretion outer membrane protein
MERLTSVGSVGVLWLGSLLCILTPLCGYGADAASGSAAQNLIRPPGTAQAGTGLALEEVVRTALENHSSIKSAAYQTDAQDALLHQQMAAYYPNITFNNFYRTNNTGGRFDQAAKAFDTLSSVANVSMTLYNFGKREGNVQSARDTLEATQYSANATANNVVLAAKQAYYGVLQANALLNVNEETVKDREATLKQTQSFYDVGTRPKSDVTQAQANLYLAQASLIAARNGVEVAWANLRNAMGVDDYPVQPLADELSTEPFPMSLDEAKQVAFAARPEILQLDALMRAQDQQIAVARRSHLPDLLLSSSYGRQAAHSEIFPLNPTWLVQLNLNIPIFNGFQTTYQLQQALANYGSAKEQLRLQRQQVALQVEQNYLNLMAARDVVRANEAAVQAAKENLELHEARYQVGYAPIVEVTTAQTTYTTAQTSYVNALVSYKLSQAQLLNAIGRQ